MNTKATCNGDILILTRSCFQRLCLAIKSYIPIDHSVLNSDRSVFAVGIVRSMMNSSRCCQRLLQVANAVNPYFLPLMVS